MVFSLRSVGAVCSAMALAALPSLISPPIWARATGSSPSVTSVALPPLPLLPKNFVGWTVSGAAQTGTAPEVVDGPNADVLKEYGLKDFATGEYSHGGDHVAVRAMRFVDATGAYGAFTFYRKPEMRAEEVGKEAATNGREVVFWNGATLVDAIFDRFGSPERDALKGLAAALPPTPGPEGVPPSLPRYLPAASLDGRSVRYAIGPAAYERTGGVLPPSVVDFSRDAEAITAQYSTRGGKGTLTVLEYPTPQMAGERAKALDALLQQSPLAGSSAGALGVHRSGPLVAVTSGSFSREEAQALLAKVKYEAAVTWNHPEGYVSEVGKTAKLLLGIATLIGVLGAAAILLGLFLGGGRALLRLARGKTASTLNDEEFISLNLGG